MAARDKRPSVWTSARILRALLRTEDLFSTGRELTPVRHNEHHTVNSDEDLVSHLRWMVLALPSLVEEGHKDKALRWLGFVQGALWAKGLATISDLKSCNREEVPVDLEVNDLVILATEPSRSFRVAKISHGYDPGTGLALLLTEAEGHRHGWEDIQLLRKK